MNKKITKIKQIAIASVVTGGMMVNSCSLVKDLEYQVEENPLEMHGDEVELKINGKFIEKGLHKKALVEVTPTFVCKDGTEIPFDMRAFQGEKAVGNGEVIPKEGKSFTYTSKVPYQACMEEGEVVVKVLPKKGTKEKDLITTDAIADGTIITPYLIQLDDQVIACDDNFKRITTHTTTAVINYDKGKFNVKSSELKQQDIKDFEMFIVESTPDNRREIKKITIQSHASPEGEVDINQTLAADRAGSAEAYLMNYMKKTENTKGQAASFYAKDPRGEDWEGFKTEVQKTSHEDKDLILRVLEMTSDLNKREEDIRNMAKTYKFLEKEVLPQLRRSQMELTYDKIGYSDEELKQISKSNPDTLNVEELLYAATLFNDLSDKLTVYNAAERLFGNDYRTVNNVGYILYLQNDLAGAASKFEKANGIQQNPISTNNMGAIAHMSGDREKARSLFDQAGSASEVNYNKGLIAVQDGNYADAISNMGGNKTFNMALAQVLNGDNETAGSTIDQSADADAALSFYLKAIIGARTNDIGVLTSNLKKAVEKDASLKAKAAKDAEFIDHRENAEFQSIIG